MQRIVLVAVCGFMSMIASAQFTYKIKTDSLKVTNDSCSAELILENSTKSVNGFLYNKGNGRTEFRKGLVKLNDTTYVIGGDTLRVGVGSQWTTSGSDIYYNTGNVIVGNDLTSNRLFSPSIIGGTASNSGLSLKMTTGSAGSQAFRLLSGNNGSVQSMYIPYSTSGAQVWDFNFGGNRGLIKITSGTDAGYTGFRFDRAGAGAFMLLLDDVGSLTGTYDSQGKDFILSNTIGNIRFGVGSPAYTALHIGTNRAVSVGSSNAAHSSAQFEVVSTINDKATLLTRHTTAQKSAITSPANGLETFDTDLQAKSIYTNEWQQVATTSATKNGVATLASGTVTITTSAVKTGSIIMVVHNTASGTQGILSVPSGFITTGTSFVINSSNNSDNSTVNWWIIN
jgi:hypothetical protein